ncbi:MAG: endo-1,4-beta-xylanase [Victivallales bacterium]|jgi:GH35 family endo-1,4-beta-xylanase|nr:endo-1,4-beta-xylanase [Victivallales bacterium]
MTSRQLMDSITRDMDHPRGGIEERIELDTRRHRMGWGRFVLSDVEGTPLKGAELKLIQKRHEFLFGSNLFKLGDFRTDAENELYEKRFKKVFNHASLPFYWDTMEPSPGKLRFAEDSQKIARRPATDFAVRWCHENRIRPKGHWLFCDNFVPRWLPQNSRDLMILLEERIATLAGRYGKTVTIWDTVNEAFSYPRFFSKTIGGSVTPQDYVYEVFRLAEKYFPNYTELCYNDGTDISFEPFHYSTSPVYLLAQNLLERGVRLGGLGMQFHLYGELNDFASDGKRHFFFDPHHLFNVLDQYALLGIPLHITEISLPTYPGLPRREAEELQAKVLRNFYRLWFSQKNMKSIVWWNLVDQTAYGDENKFDAGLLGKNLEEKPAYRVLDDLVNREWHTECRVKTDENGVADWNGFYGDYDLEITLNQTTVKREISLSSYSHNELRLNL